MLGREPALSRPALDGVDRRARWQKRRVAVVRLARVLVRAVVERAEGTLRAKHDLPQVSVGRPHDVTGVIGEVVVAEGLHEVDVVDGGEAIAAARDVRAGDSVYPL